MKKKILLFVILLFGVLFGYGQTFGKTKIITLSSGLGGTTITLPTTEMNSSFIIKGTATTSGHITIAPSSGLTRGLTYLFYYQGVLNGYSLIFHFGGYDTLTATQKIHNGEMLCVYSDSFWTMRYIPDFTQIGIVENKNISTSIAGSGLTKTATGAINVYSADSTGITINSANQVALKYNRIDSNKIRFQAVSIHNMAPTIAGGLWQGTGTTYPIPLKGTPGQLVVNQSGIWTAKTVSGDATIDATGSMTVVALQGRTMSSTAPTSGYVLAWSGSAWTPTVSSSGGGTYYAGSGLTLTGNTFSHAIHSGDAIGVTSLVVTGLQGHAVSATAPGVYQILQWSGIAWTPTSVGGAYTINGDVTGNLSTSIVSRINGTNVGTLSPNTNDVLMWQGGYWTNASIKWGVPGTTIFNVSGGGGLTVTIPTILATIGGTTYNVLWDGVTP